MSRDRSVTVVVPVYNEAPRVDAVVADVVDTLSWSPDGQQLVYATPNGDAPGLAVVDVATGQATPLKTPKDRATGPTWSRENIIAFIEPRGGDIGAFIQLIRPNGEPVASSPLDAKGAPQIANGSIVWSPDGPTEPRRVYAKHGDAYYVALQMAQKCPGQKFYVMGRCGAGAPVAPAQGIEARSGETAKLARSGTDESPVGAADAPQDAAASPLPPELAADSSDRENGL